MDDIITAISTVGFPIVATLILAYLLLQEKDNHKQEMFSIQKSIDANTLIMSELKLLIGELRKDIGLQENETDTN